MCYYLLVYTPLVHTWVHKCILIRLSDGPFLCDAPSPIHAGCLLNSIRPSSPQAGRRLQHDRPLTVALCRRLQPDVLPRGSARAQRLPPRQVQVRPIMPPPPHTHAIPMPPPPHTHTSPTHGGIGEMSSCPGAPENASSSTQLRIEKMGPRQGLASVSNPILTLISDQSCLGWMRRRGALCPHAPCLRP